MKYAPFLNVRRFKLMAVLVAVLIIVPGIYFTLIRKSPDSSSQVGTQVKKEVYSCSMHPSVVSDRPGKCPICHMDLQKVESDELAEPQAQAGGEQKEKKILFYRHPMKPDITSPVPAKDEMGMDYTPVFDEEMTGSSNSNVDGRAGFTLSRGKQQLIGVTTAKANLKPLSYEVRASGKAAFDPELFTAVEEYRQAIFSQSQMKDSPYDTLSSGANELVKSVKTKLKLMGLTDAQIRKLGSGETSSMNLILPKGKVWIYAEIFEYEIAGIKEGQTVEVSAPSVPGKVFAGTLTSVSPILNSQSRTVRVRALVPDPEGVLRPDTFVNVKIKVDLGEKLTIPVDSVLHSGGDDFVFVVQGEGRFEPRKVTVGVKTRDAYEILSGLSPEESVVTAANFLIDSESRLRGVLQNMKSPPATPQNTPSQPPTHGGERSAPPGGSR